MTSHGKRAAYPAMKRRLKIDSWGIVVIGFLGAVLMLMALLSWILD